MSQSEGTTRTEVRDGEVRRMHPGHAPLVGGVVRDPEHADLAVASAAAHHPDLERGPHRL